jgi:pyrroline-5-carboxylate reductase
MKEAIMFTNKKIAFIGSGVMAEAMIAGIIHKGLTAPDQLLAADPLPERGDYLENAYGILPLTDNCLAVKEADVVVFSVKPQRLSVVMEELCGKIPAKALVLSIVAGAPVQKLVDGLSHPVVVRAMPNTPAQIGEGITVWTASPSVTDENRERARQILLALGEEIFVDDETYLDMATALSGTGPAYVFLFMEAMIDAGVHLGLPRRMAEHMVVQTIRGSVDFSMKNKSFHPAQLRNQVTSPGGTSAEALYYLEKAGFRTAISRAIWAAYERSVQLGKGGHGHVPEKNGQ